MPDRSDGWSRRWCPGLALEETEAVMPVKRSERDHRARS